jgi:hypothetical protein
MSRLYSDVSLASLASATGCALLLSAAYVALRFPVLPKEDIGHSLAALGPESPHWTVYPEDYYPGGEYVDLPAGRMRYWLFGPEDGKRVRPPLNLTENHGV